MGLVALTFFVYGLIIYAIIALFKDVFGGPRK